MGAILFECLVSWKWRSLSDFGWKEEVSRPEGGGCVVKSRAEQSRAEQSTRLDFGSAQPFM